MRLAVVALLLIIIQTNLHAQDTWDLRQSENLLRLEHISEEEKEQLYLWELQNPLEFSQALHLLWEDRTLDPQVRTRVAWWLGRLNPHEIAPGIDSLEILKEALTWERSQRSSDLVADLQYLVTASEYALHDAGGTKEENLLRDKIAHIRDPKLKLAAEVAFLADRALEGNFSQEDSKRLAELQATLQLDPISNGDLLTANNLALTLRTLGQIGEYQTIADRMSAVCRERPAYSFCMILLYEKGLTLAKQEDRSRGEQAIAYFSESLHLAQKIRSASGKARAHYGLLLSHRLVGNIEAAIDNGQAATEFFRNSPAKEWAAISYIQLARAYLDKSDLVATKKSLQSAYPYIPQEFSSIKSLYHKLSAEVAERERDPWLALQETKAYWTEETKIRAEDTTKQYVQMRNDQLRKENSWQTEQIVLLKKYRLLAIMTGVLILIICIFFFLFWRQAQQVAYSRQKLKDVLDHLDQGLAIINEKFQIQSGYSPFLDKLFQHMPNALTSLNFIDFMKRHTRGSESAWAMAGEILQSCLGETALTWEFNFSHLPRDVRFEDRDLQLHWQALYDKSGAIDRYLIAIRDVTLIKSLEEQVRRDHEKLAKIDCKMREILSGNPSRIRYFFRDMKSWLERPDQAFVPRSELLRTLHAWKGTSRSLGLMDLSQSIHQIEDSLKDSLEDSGRVLKTLLLIQDDYLHVLDSVLVTHERTEDKKTLYDFAASFQTYLEGLFGKEGIDFRGLFVCDRVKGWSSDLLLQLEQVLIQGFHNTIDHGFVRVRSRIIQKEPAEILLNSYLKHDKIVVELIDNGFGLDWEFLAAKAHEKGLANQPKASWIELLFEDGVTSAREVSAISGRGIGLSAMRAICRSLKGDLSLAPGRDRGVLIHMNFPVS